jgi:hypothetical protein
MLTRFLAFSAEMTAFSVFDLLGTGQAEAYLAAVVERVGSGALEQLFDAYHAAACRPPTDREFILQARIFDDDKLGPIARNIIKMWYVGTWYELPHGWNAAFGGRAENDTFVVSADAYAEGLLWTAIGANPPGAKAPGYGSWAQPPQIP